MYIIYLLVSFFASVAGSICGIGGGVIMKPVLDSLNVMGVSEISFLSGCTVFSMSIISVTKQLRSSEKAIDVDTGTPIAIGAAIGGIVGKQIFQYAYVLWPNENKVGAIQAFILMLVTLLTLIYTLKKDRITSLHIKNKFTCIGIGLFLGVMSAFLGIGGGPINLMVLAFFFSMEIKKAAANSLYIILFSQLTSIVSTIVQGKVPEFNFIILLIMVAGGVSGGIIGSKLNKKITEKNVDLLFCILMMLIIGINIYNIYQFSI